MSGCCDPSDYPSVFNGRFARALGARYRRRGPDRTARHLLDFLGTRGVEGASVLEIGGGIGDLQLELLSRGAARTTNLELVGAYDVVAADLAQQAGVADRMERRVVDIVAAPDSVEPADVVILHRVVCCYPDHVPLLQAAADHARRLLVFSYPRTHLLNRAVIGAENLRRRLTRSTFRTFAHPPEEMVRTLQDAGLRPSYRHSGRIWTVTGFQRP